MSKSRSQLIKYLKEIDVTNKVVLDAGAGPKEKWARNWTKGEPKTYITLDINKEYGTTIVHDLNYAFFDITGEKNKTYINKFDVVFFIETLEHLWNVWVTMNTIKWLLKKGGKVYFSTPLINPPHDTWDYSRYTDEWYKEILTQYGFKNIKIKPRIATDGFPHLLQFYKAEGLRMSKIRRGQEEKLRHIGYFVEATK